MKLAVITVVFLGLVFLSGCLNSSHNHYSAEMTTKPGDVESGKPVELVFQVKNPEGENVSDLEIVHERPMHLFMVSRDLSQYFHEHPTKHGDGTYKLPFTFPNGGEFKIYIDFKPAGEEEQTVESFDIEVAGKKLEKKELVPDEKFEKEVDGVIVKMRPSGELRRKEDLMLNFHVLDAATREPVDDLQNYLGEKAHFVIIRKGLARFVHAHPMSAENMADNVGSNKDGMKMEKGNMPDPDAQVTAMTNFPNRGIYKIFAQFKRNDKVITVPFVFKVE